MAVYKIESPWFVVIDTTEYAGNFEREMTAFCTGQVGECDVGDSESEVYGREEIVDFEGYVTLEPDDHGCYRPCSIYDHDGNGYKSVVIFFEEEPTRDQMEVIARRARLFPQKGISGWKKLEILRVGVYQNKVIRKTKLVKIY